MGHGDDNTINWLYTEGMTTAVTPNNQAENRKTDMWNGDEDRLGSGKSIYDVSYKSLMWRNFLAGLSRGAGWFIFQVLVIVVLGVMLNQLLMPYVRQISLVFTNLSQTLETMSNPAQFGGSILESLFRRGE